MQMALLQRFWNTFSPSSSPVASSEKKFKTTTTKTDRSEESSCSFDGDSGGGTNAAAGTTSAATITTRTTPLHVRFISEDSEGGVGAGGGGDEREAAYRVGSKLKHFFPGVGWTTCTVVDVQSCVEKTSTANNNNNNANYINEGCEFMYLVLRDSPSSINNNDNNDKSQQHQQKADVVEALLLTEAEMDCAVALLSVQVGSRVSIFREDEESYYNATVTKLREEQPTGFCVYYDFGIEEWVDLSRHRFHLLPPPSFSSSSNFNHNSSQHQSQQQPPQQQQQQRVVSEEAQSLVVVAPSKNNENDSSSSLLPLSSPPSFKLKGVSIGARVSVTLRPSSGSSDNKSAAVSVEADVVRIRDMHCADRFCLEFQDGTRRWMDLSPETCRVLSLGDEREEIEEELMMEEEEDDDCLVVDNGDEQAQQVSSSCSPCPLASSAADVVAVAVASCEGDHLNKKGEAEELLFADSSSSPVEQRIMVRESDNNKIKSDVSEEPSLIAAQMGDSDDDDESSQSSEDELVPSSEAEEVIVGSRVAVWWPDDRKYYSGTVVEYRRMRKRNPFRILYDDDDEEWIDFHKHNFRLLPGGMQRPSGDRGPDHAAMLQRVQVGMRIGVWWNLDKEYYQATVQKINKSGAKPYHLVYNDGEEEKIDLNAHDFCIVNSENGEDNAVGVPDSQSDYCGLLSGDEGSADSDDDDLIDAEVEQARPDLSQVEIGTRVAVWWEGDRQFYKGTVTKIRNSKLKYSIEYDDGDKHWIDLSMETFRLLPPSSNKTAVRTRRSGPKRSRSAVTENDTSTTEEDNASDTDAVPCREKTKKRKFAWRHKQDTPVDNDDQNDAGRELPAKKRKLSKQGKRVAVEQINPKTGEVVQVWSSMRKAERMTGIHIRRVLLDDGEPTAGGFFWRIAGESNKPGVLPPHRSKKAVEQLCLQTGDVLAEFDSISSAKRAVGNACIGDVCDGKARSTVGYYWRWKGSHKLPESLRGLKKTIEVRKGPSGSVFKKFPSAGEAAVWAKVEESSVCRWCREKSNGKGFYWKYCFTEGSRDDQHNGRRISIQLESRNASWEEGIVDCYNEKTKKHIISLDRGSVEVVDLNEVKHIFRSVDGDEPVEQICIATRKVIRVFPSARAAAKATKTHLRRILPVLSKASQSAGGFFWRYKFNIPRKAR